MASLITPPTKSNLLNIKEELVLAREGHELLDRKRGVLLNELLRIIYELKEMQSELQKKLRTVYESFQQACIQMGEERVALALCYQPVDWEIDVVSRSMMGVTIPILAASIIPEQQSPGLETGTPEWEESYTQMQELLPLLIKYVEKNVTFTRLASEVKKTQRRVNSLENIFIPEHTIMVKEIENILEEHERENFFRLKRVKNIIAKSHR